MSKKPVEKKEVETTGHEWDGIQEFNNPLPRWWVWVFYVTIVWGVWYSIAYPAWPLLKGATAGYLGFSTREEVAQNIQRFTDMNAALEEELAAADLAALERDTDLHNFAIQSGRATFVTWCSQCHGSGADGIADGNGYPSLIDNDWLWGGEIETIATTIRHGIRSADDDDTRWSEMPAFGDDYLEQGEIADVVAYVLSLSDLPSTNGDAAAGAEVFADNCASCHGEDGTGDREQGAPNLADALWLYGDSEAEVTQIVTEGPFGVMPSWTAKLTQAQINGVALYVHQLGGGE